MTLADIFIRAIPILWALTIHEFAHGWVAHKCGDDTALLQGRLTLNPLAHLDPFGTLAFLIIGFGWAKPVPVNPYNFRKMDRDNVLVSLAGVTANLLSALMFAAAYRTLAFLVISGILPAVSIIQPIADILALGVIFNLVLIFFNLIPIPPLDGSHVLEVMLPWEVRQAYNANIRPYGPFILMGLVFLGRPILDFIIGVPVDFLSTLLLGI